MRVARWTGCFQLLGLSSAMANSGQALPFSWKRAAKHVGVPVLLAVIASGVAAAVTDFGDPNKMGEETGRLLVPGLALALLASWLVQTKRIAYAWVFGVLAAVVFAGAVATPIIKRTRSRAVALHSSDTLPLELVDIGGEPHFQHPYLRFSFVQPRPGFVLNTDAQRATGSFIPQDDSVHAYALAEEFPGDLVLVTLQKANRIDREQLEGFVAGLSKIKQQYGQAAREVENRVIWEPSFHGAKVHVVIAETNHFRLYAYVDDFDTDAEYIVGLVGLSLGEDPFGEVFESFRARAPLPARPD